MQICVAAGEVSGDQILAPILSRVSGLRQFILAVSRVLVC